MIGYLILPDLENQSLVKFVMNYVEKKDQFYGVVFNSRSVANYVHGPVFIPIDRLNYLPLYAVGVADLPVIDMVVDYLEFKSFGVLDKVEFPIRCYKIEANISVDVDFDRVGFIGYYNWLLRHSKDLILYYGFDCQEDSYLYICKLTLV